MSDVTSTNQLPPATAEPKLQVGRVWSLTFQTFRRAPWRFILLALLPLLFSITLSLMTTPLRHDRSAAALAAIVGLIVIVAQLVFQLVTQSGSIYAAGRVLSGTNFTIGESLGVGFRRFWPVLGLVILLLIIILIGYLALIIPGIIAALVLAVAFQVCVIEGRGPIESMQRSVYLTKGNRWRIFGAYLLVLVVPMILLFVLFGLITGVVGAASGQHSQAGGLIIGSLAMLLLLPFFLVFGAIVNVLLAVIFVELRRVKDGGFSREEVATVFD